MNPKVLFGLLSAIATLIGFIPYVYSILRGRTHAHLFTWFVWGILTSIIFAIQLSAKAGPGAWCTGFTALTVFAIIIVGFRSGEKKGTTRDRIALVASLGTIPIWLAAKDPTFSAVLVTLIDVAAFYPTVAKTFRAPRSENLFYYCIWLVKYPASLAALTVFSVANAVYPAVWTILGAGFVGMMVYRRKQIS